MRLYRFSFHRSRWAALGIAATFFASLFVFASGAQAVVVDMNATGQSVGYNASNTADYTGVALIPGTCSDLAFSGTCASLGNAGVPLVTSGAPCVDPSLPADLATFGGLNDLPGDALCYHGGAVMNNTETFDLTWDSPWPNGVEHNYWEGTKYYVEQYLRDVADASRSNSMSSPFALTTQYTDGGHTRAQSPSAYGGGCVDYGSVGGSQCDFGSKVPTGHDYGSSGCTPSPSGASYVGAQDTVSNGVCLTDAQIKSEVTTMVTQEGILGHTTGTPTFVVLTPPGVVECLNATNKLCSANDSLSPPQPQVSNNPETQGDGTPGSILAGTYQVETTYLTSSGESLPSASASTTTTGSTSTITVASPPNPTGVTVTGWNVYMTTDDGEVFHRLNSAPLTIGQNYMQSTPPASGPNPPKRAAFCSYHSQVNVNGTDVAYVVQPWTPLTACDEPEAPVLQENPTPEELSSNFGLRLVSPLSQSQIPAVVDPKMNGWFALDGAEMNDNGGCTPLAKGLDSVSVGSSAQNPYLLQREFNNAGAMSSEPSTYGGCAPNVILTPAFVVPSGVNPGDALQFDGSKTASTLMVPNAGYAWNFGDGTTATGPSVQHVYSKAGNYTVTLTVTDRGGYTATLAQPITVGNPTPSAPSNPPTAGGTGGSKGSSGPLSAHMQLLPQSLRSVLRSGITLAVRSNQAADGIATVIITRSAAKRAHIKAGRGSTVVIGRGTVSQVKDGTVTLHLHLSKAIVAKLKRMRALDLTVRLALVGTDGHQTLLAAGRY